MVENYFAKNLKWIRKNLHYTQGSLAKIIRKDRSLIGHWEREKREPTLEDIIKVCNFFSIPIDTFLTQDLSILKDKNLENSPKNYRIKLLQINEDISIDCISTKPFEALEKEEKEEIINKMMDELYEYKRNLKKEQK